MFDRSKYTWAVLCFAVRIFPNGSVFAKKDIQDIEKEKKTNPESFTSKDLVWDTQDPSEELLETIMKKAIKTLGLRQNRKAPVFKWLQCPVKGYLASNGYRAFYLDGSKVIDIPVKRGSSYEDITDKVYRACGITPVKKILGMLNKKSNPDMARPALINKIFEKKNGSLLQSNINKKSNQKDLKKNKADTGKENKAVHPKNKFEPKVTISNIEKNTIDIDGTEVQCFTCTKKTVQGAIRRRLIRKSIASVFGFMFKNKKVKWIYSVELFSGKKGDLITEEGWKVKYKQFIKKHDNDSALKDQIIWNTSDEDQDKQGSNKNRYNRDWSDDWSDYLLYGQNQSLDEAQNLNVIKNTRLTDI